MNISSNFTYTGLYNNDFEEFPSLPSPKKHYLSAQLLSESVDNPLNDAISGVEPDLKSASEGIHRKYQSKNDHPALEAIKNLVEWEDKSHPYSDREIKEKIESTLNYPLSRRTVTNLRNKSKIPDAHGRKMVPKIRREPFSQDGSSVLEAIKKLVELEDKSLPLTDKQIKERIEHTMGVYIARATVQNLRKKLNIPDSRSRKV